VRRNNQVKTEKQKQKDWQQQQTNRYRQGRSKGMNLQYHKYHFDNFDLLAETALGWQLNFSQIDKGATNCDVFQVMTPDVYLGYLISNRALKQAGAPPEDMWTFTLSSPTAPAWDWGGHHVSGSTIIVYRPGSDFTCVSKAGFEVYTFSVLPELVEEACERLRITEILNKMMSERIIQCSPVDTLDLWLKATNLTMFAANRVLQYNTWQAGQIKLLENILLTISAGFSVYSKIKHKKINRIFNKIDQYLEDSQFNPTSVCELCNVAGVTERTLQHNFKKLYGITPKAYLKSLGLNRVRQDLLRGLVPGSCVSDVANKWGFWHMGQFAADYRKYFGELPSDTIKRPIETGLEEVWSL